MVLNNFPNNTKDALTKLAQIVATNLGQQRTDKIINSGDTYTINKVFFSSNSMYDRYGTEGEARRVDYPSSVWRFNIDGGLLRVFIF